MFNPVLEKGGSVFRQVVERMNGRAFAIVPGWTSHRDKSGRFDTAVFRKSAESEGLTYDGYLPKEPAFVHLPNVTVLAPRDNVGEIYAQTRILMVPSQWEEQFARVIYEACVNDIPVIASAVGGILEHSRHCAILLDDYASPQAWIERIMLLDDSSVYTETAQRGKTWVRSNYDLKRLAIEFMNLVKASIR
jgi:glycosyltransferase involved in cell wall biosynthesis